MTRMDLLKESEIVHKYLGIPFKWGGTDRAGMDCWQLFRAIYRDLGYNVWQIEDTQYPARIQAHNFFMENYHREWDIVQYPKTWDAVILLTKRGLPAHIGVVLSGGRFIHCPKVGVIVSRFTDPAWSNAVHSFYRFREAVR